MTDASALQAAQQPAQAPFSGTLKISVTSALGLIPIANAQIVISYTGDPENPIGTYTTDSSGQTGDITLSAPGGTPPLARGGIQAHF